MKRAIAVIGACLLAMAPLAVHAQSAPYKWQNIGTSACVTISPATLYIGVHNNSASAQSVTVSVYDGPNSNGISIDTVAPLGPTQWIKSIDPGFPVYSNYLTACPNGGAPTGTGIQILYR